MNQVKGVLLFCFVLFLAGILALPAQDQATQPPRPTNPTTVGPCGLPASGANFNSSATLRTFTLTQNCVYNNSDDYQLVFARGSGEFTINGNGHSIIGGGFSVNENTVLNLNNLTLSQSNKLFYVGLATLNARSVTFSSNSVPTPLYFLGGTANLTNVQFLNNTQTEQVRAFYASAITIVPFPGRGTTVRINNGIFRGNRNSAVSSAVISIDDRPLYPRIAFEIQGCMTFENNVRSDGTAASNYGTFQNRQIASASACAPNVITTPITPLAPTAGPAPTATPFSIVPTSTHTPLPTPTPTGPAAWLDNPTAAQLGDCGLPTVSARFDSSAPVKIFNLSSDCTYHKWNTFTGTVLRFTSGTFTINGNGHSIIVPGVGDTITLDSAGTSAGDSVVLNLNNLTFKQGRSHYVLVGGNTTLNANNVTFSGLTSGQSALNVSSITPAQDGNAIANLTNVHFLNNVQYRGWRQGDGSAIHVFGLNSTVRITNGIFRGNRNGQGGDTPLSSYVISVYSGLLELNGCMTFESNFKLDGTTPAPPYGGGYTEYDGASKTGRINNRSTGVCLPNFITATPITPTVTNTPITPTITPTDTPITPTITPTDTPITPTITPTDTPITPTITPTDTPITPTVTNTPTGTLTPTITPTDTPITPTVTNTPTGTLTPTITPTDTPITPTVTLTPSITPTDTMMAPVRPEAPPIPRPAPQRKPKKTSTPTPTFTASPQPMTCLGLGADTGIAVYATYGLGSGVQCQRLDGGGIGIPSIVNAGFIDAVDIWGYVEQGVEVCFPQSGTLLFLDARMMPRAAAPLASYIANAMTCGWIESPGSIVLMPPP